MVLLIVRTVARARKKEPLHIDDGFSLLASMCLVVSYGLDIYSAQWAFSGNALAEDTPNPEEILQQASTIALYSVIGESFSWATIFLVKFSFLFVFRALVRRIGFLEILWWCTLAVCIPTACISISASFIACPATDRILICKWLSSDLQL